MAFTVPTAADLKTRFPAFEACDDQTVDFALAEAAALVDDSWSSQADFTLGRLLYAAHILTLEGYGSGSEAKTAGGGLSAFKTIKSGALTLTRGDDAAAVAGKVETTTFGQRFTQLQGLNRGGPLLAVVPA